MDANGWAHNHDDVLMVGDFVDWNNSIEAQILRAGHLWCVHCNGILEKQKYERQKEILEVPTQLFGI